MNPPTPPRIRPATEADVPVIFDLIYALATYEKLAHEVVATPEQIRTSLFGPKPEAEVLLADIGTETIGFALYFYNYSTFLGKKGIYLEDLFVQPPHRGQGIGKALLHHLARIATHRNCGRLEWSVLDWNQPSIAFYESLGAEPQTEWTVYRLTGSALKDLADLENASSSGPSKS